MRTVKVITELRVEEVPYSGDKVAINSFGMRPVSMGDGGFSPEGLLVERDYVPVNRIVRCTEHTREDVYIAYSKEVEDLIGVPCGAIIDRAEAAESRCVTLERKKETLSRRVNDAESRLDDALSMSILDKFKFMIGIKSI